MKDRLAGCRVDARKNPMSVSENFSFVQKEITRAAKKSGRDPSGITLVAVTKNQDDDKLDAALACGQRVFGENKVQEAMVHWTARRTAYPDLALHLIGPLQTNKAAEAVALFDVIETLDRPKLCDALAAHMQKQGRRVPCYIQVNTGAEEQKGGVLPRDLSSLLAYATQECGLIVRGLMCIPPVDEPPALHFSLLAQMARDHGLTDLSMGMSGDFGWAIACGATHVRIGTALFGARD